MSREPFKPGEPVVVNRGVDAFLEPVMTFKRKKRQLVAVTLHLGGDQIDWMEREVKRRDAELADNASKAAIVREALDAYIAKQEGENE